MCKISEEICLLFMLILSVIDMRIRKVPAVPIVAAGIVGMGCQLMEKNLDWQQAAGGIVIGILFLSFSKVTEEGIGYGDSLGILSLGMYLGLWNLLMVLSITFFLVFIMFLLIFVRTFFRKYFWGKPLAHRKLKMAFYPFLTGGYICFLLAGGMNL